MNRVSLALAREHDVATVDVTGLTVNMSGGAHQKRGAVAGLAEYDYYHEYDHGALWRAVWNATRRACAQVLLQPT